jgi:biotin synthase
MTQAVSVSLIENLKTRVIEGGEITFDEALSLLALEDASSIDALLEAAHEITTHFHRHRAGLCSLINAKSNLCGEDCKFCAQSVRYDTSATRYELVKPDVIVRAAKHAESHGAQNFCIVTSGDALSDDEFERLLPIIRRLCQETTLGIDASLGFLTRERVDRLKEAGLRRFNSNLQTSRDYYSEIVSTHAYDKRIETLEHLREGGLGMCSGGILGMGESPEDRIKMAMDLKRFKPECLPVNVLHPVPGTPLASETPLQAEEILKTIAVFRFILPQSNIKLAGGREKNLGEHQEKALKGGANGLIVGGYLTTPGNAIQDDFKMLSRAGYEF